MSDVPWSAPRPQPTATLPPVSGDLGDPEQSPRASSRRNNSASGASGSSSSASGNVGFRPGEGGAGPRRRSWEAVPGSSGSLPMSRAGSEDVAGGSAAAATKLLKKGWRALKKSAVGYSYSGVGGGVDTSAFVDGVQARSTSPGAVGSGAGAGNGFEDAREQRLQQLSSVWLTEVLPQWDPKKQKSVKSKRVRDLFFRGVPTSVRGRVWPVALGNTLNVSPDLLDVLRDQARQNRDEYMREKKEMDNADGDLGGFGGRAEVLMAQDARASQKAINMDLPRTFPSLSFFHAEDSPYKVYLRELLEAFVLLRPDVGYAQGMSFLAAFLLLYLDPSDAFICFVNMMSRSCFLHFFRMKMPEVRIYMHVHQRLFREELPALYVHFQKADIKPEMYLVNWIMSMYCQALPLECTSRVWDLYFMDGDVMLFRVALGILRLYSTRLLHMPFDELAYFLSHIPDDIDLERLIASVRKVQTCTASRFKDVYRDVSATFGATDVK